VPDYLSPYQPSVPTFREVSQRVRRYRPSDLLPALTEVSASVSFPKDDVILEWRDLAPWVMSTLARECIVHGNEHRNPHLVSTQDVTDLLIAFNASHDSVPSGTLDQTSGIFNRIAYEQFPYQESDGEEISRAYAMYTHALPISQTKTLTSETLDALLGGLSLSRYLRAIWAITVLTVSNRGRWQPEAVPEEAWVQFSSRVDRTEIEAVANTLIGTVETMKMDYRNAYKDREPPSWLQRYAYNPLQRTPLMRTRDGVVLAPQPRLIVRRGSPAGLYYHGWSQLGPGFATDLGEVFQTYVGQTLRLISPAAVHTEIVYGKSSERSVDWFVVFDNLVVLVECKALRATISARVADRDFAPFLQDRLNGAFKQIDRSVQKIGEGHQSFSQIPRDRNLVGLVVTAEPLYSANSPTVRSLLHSPSIPTLVASMREVEKLPRLEENALAHALLQISGDGEMSGWMLSTSLNRFEPDTGPGPQAIMDDAWSQTSLGSDPS